MAYSFEPKQQQEAVVYNDYGVAAVQVSKPIWASIVPWLMCGLGATFYIYEYLLRVAPSVMTNELMLSFHIGAAALGSMVAFYYYIYTPMQLIVGLLMDRYGPRRLFTIAGLACGLGTYLFASTTNIFVAEMGRFMVGFGSAFGFVGVLKLATIWLPPDRFAMVAGLTSALGTMGGILGNLVLTTLVSHQGWRLSSYSAAVFGLALTIVMFLALRDGGKYQYRPSTVETTYSHSDFASIFKNFLSIIRNPQIWVVGIVGCFTYVANTAFADLWGNPFLRQVYHFNADQAARAISTGFLGWAIGGPIMGMFSDFTKQRRLPLTIGSAASAIAIAAVVYLPNMPVWGIYASLFFFSFFSSAHVVCFAVGREISPTRSAGTAVAVTNMFTMIGGILFQPMIGKILDMHWSGQIVNGVRVYSTGDYQLALSILPICMLVTVFLTLFMRETNCKATYK